MNVAHEGVNVTKFQNWSEFNQRSIVVASVVVAAVVVVTFTTTKKEISFFPVFLIESFLFFFLYPFYA
jgi:hypothetical protein